MMKRRDILVASAAFSMMGRRAMVDSKSGLHVPAEEDQHARTFMQWPVNRRVHPDPVFLRMLQDIIADIANTISQFEPVVMLADAGDHAGARKKLSADVELWDIPTEDLWCRDSGPLFAYQADGSLAVSHLKFNGWGGKQVHKGDGLSHRQLGAVYGGWPCLGQLAG